MTSFAPTPVVDAFKKDPAMDDAVQALSRSGVYTIHDVQATAEDNVYKAVVAAQAKFEQAIVDGLKNGDITSAVAVIHTGGPCNPLSYKVNNRTGILESLLDAGGQVACVYQEGSKLDKNAIPTKLNETGQQEYLKAADRFDGYKAKYPHLSDYPVTDSQNELTQKMSGASYQVQTKDGASYFYSFQSFQVQTIGQSNAPRSWAVWAGNVAGEDPVKPAVLERLAEVNAFLTQTGTPAFFKTFEGPNRGKEAQAALKPSEPVVTG